MKRLSEEVEEAVVCETCNKPYQYFEQLMTKRVHHFYISKVIEEPEHYVDMVHRIRMAGPEDVVFIHLNTPGGDLSTGVQIINAIAASQAHVVCSIESESYSLGTMIFLSADEFIVQDNCMMMFHQWTGGVFGKGHEQKAQFLATEEWFNDLARTIYIPFLSEEEFNSIIEGKDIWIQSADIKERLNVMVAAMTEEMEAEAERLETEQEELDAEIAKAKKKVKAKK